MASIELIVIGTFVFFFASFFGVVTGGVGLITNAVLVALGIPPVSSVAAVKVGGFGRNILAASEFRKAGKLDMNLAKGFIILAAIGGLIGAMLAVYLDPTLFRILIALAILAISISFLVPMNLGKYFKKEHRNLGYLTVFASYALSSLTATGTGIIRTFGISSLFKKDFLESVGTKKIPSIANRAVATGIYLIFGVIDWQLTVPMLFSGIAGGYLGTKFAIKRGERFVRNLIIVIAIIFSIKMLFF